MKFKKLITLLSIIAMYVISELGGFERAAIFGIALLIIEVSLNGNKSEKESD